MSLSSFSKGTQRRAVSALFFMHGICFSSWASRIPHLQQKLGLNDAELGFLLFAIPVGRFVTMPLSGWLVSSFGSKKLAVASVTLCCVVLMCLGLVDNKWLFLCSLFLFGCSYNMVVISLNMQGVVLEKIFGRSIMASFHGLWSLAGFIGAVLATFLITQGISIFNHFVLVGLLVVGNVLLCYRYLPQERTVPAGKRKVFALPQGQLLVLGLLAFCCLICEGTMYDWSGIYFSKMVTDNKDLGGIGYSGFMCAMAIGRFVSDWYVTRFGLEHTLKLSGVLIFVGLVTAVSFPHLYSASFGFILVGFGVSSIIPMVYAAAGKSEHVPAPTAMVMVSTVGFTGFMIGPPVIGSLSELFSLRVSLAIVSLGGLGIVFLARKIEQYGGAQRNEEDHL